MRYEMYIKKKKNIRLIELDRPTKEYSSFLEMIRNEFVFCSKMKQYSCFLRNRWFEMSLRFVRELNNIRVSWEMRYEMYIKKKKNIRLIELDRPTKEYSSFLEMIRNEFVFCSKMKQYSYFLRNAVWNVY